MRESEGERERGGDQGQLYRRLRGQRRQRQSEGEGGRERWGSGTALQETEEAEEALAE